MQHLEVSGAVRHIYIYIYIVRQLKVNIMSLDPILSHLNPVTILTSHLFETHHPPIPPLGSAPKPLQSKCFYTFPPALKRPYENYWSN